MTATLSSALYCDAPEEQWGSCIGVGGDWSVTEYSKNHCPEGFTYTGDSTGIGCGPFFEKGKCRRTTFEFDNDKGKVNCCLNEDNNAKCPPGYCKAKKNDTKCVDVLRKHCTASRMLNRNDPDRQACLDWSKNTPGKNDRNMETYCKSRATLGDPICACFQSELPDGAAACFDSDCINSGYRTQSMIDKAQNCGTYCNIDFTVAQSKVNIDQLKFNQECSDSAQQRQTQDSGTTGDPNAKNEGGANIGESNGIPSWVWYIVAGVGALILIGIIIAVVVSVGGKSTPPVSQPLWQQQQPTGPFGYQGDIQQPPPGQGGYQMF